MMEDKGKMIQIIGFDSNEKPGERPEKTGSIAPIFHADEIRSIVAGDNSRDCDKDIPLLTICIIGNKRIGKSFLTNLLICYIRCMEKNPGAESDAWMQNSEDAEVCGVQWRQCRESVTYGIWMWNQPFLIRRSDKSQIKVLLMDCQGLNDPEIPPVIDSLVTQYALQMSKIHIVNIKGDIETKDLENLENCIKSVQMYQLERMTWKLFNTLIFLHRDWSLDEQFGRRDCFGHMKSVTAEISTSLIKNAFKRCESFMLPPPGRRIIGASEDDRVKLSYLSEDKDAAEFLMQVSEFFQHLLNFPEEQEVLTNQEELFEGIQRLEKNYGDGRSDVFHFTSREEVYEQSAIMGVYDEFQCLHLPPIRKTINLEVLKDEKDLEEVMQGFWNCIEEYFVERERVMEENFNFRGGVEVSEDKVERRKQLWRRVKENIHELFCKIKCQKEEEFNEQKKQTKEIVLKTVLPGVIIATVAGILTGGIGAAVVGMVGLGALGIAGAGAGAGLVIGAGSGGIAAAKKIGDESERRRKEKNNN